MKPITPDEVYVDGHIPEVVIEFVNRMVAANWDGQQSIVRQATVAFAVAQMMSTSRDEVFNRGWLNFEPLYRASGWDVTYNKPGYNEDYEASWTFTRKTTPHR